MASNRKCSDKLETLEIWQWNCRGIRRKQALLKQHISSCGALPDIIALQETGCSPALAGYSVYEGIGQSKVATLVHKAVTAIRHDIDATDIDHVFIEIITQKRSQESIFLLNIYSPPSQRKANFNYLLGKAQQAAGRKGIVILGDFNAWHKSWGYLKETQKGKDLAREADRRKLSLITDPTRPTRVGNSISRDSCPDLAFVRGVREARWENEGETLGSDHCILRIQIETLPIRKRQGQARLTDWEAYRKTRAESQDTEITNIKSWVTGIKAD
ncbi:hypothetical protein HPB50_008440 [Hyalomma asiaticum]|uniref:Uncharacterized protein n=1 Tax=Hyalomma asiaticum TaxID=266040 RepID=A0ACB7SWD5_HYAAI|nr:hypothetical protein HPB50_008440 [Hyalomma asiaticum]